MDGKLLKSSKYWTPEKLNPHIIITAVFRKVFQYDSRDTCEDKVVADWKKYPEL